MVNIAADPFILIDGSSYLYRAYYAFPLLTNRIGEPTGAIYGFLNMLRRIMIKYQPTYAAVIFDAQGRTFRNELFEKYKSHRMLMPDNLRIQVKPLCNIIKAMGIPIIVIPGVEADDVIGTLAIKAEKMNYSVLISTEDKDMMQLVMPNITLINTKTNTLLGSEEVLNKYGVPPSLIIDLFALMGDYSDNIPGIPGVGIKTAKILLQNFGGLNALYSKLEKISNLVFRGSKNIVEKLKQNREIAYLSYQLATIKTDVEIDLNCEQLKVKQPETEELLWFLKKYEFKHWMTDIKTENDFKKNK